MTWRQQTPSYTRASSGYCESSAGRCILKSRTVSYWVSCICDLFLWKDFSFLFLSLAQRERHHLGPRPHILRWAQCLWEIFTTRTQTQWPQYSRHRGEQKRICKVRRGRFMEGKQYTGLWPSDLQCIFVVFNVCFFYPPGFMWTGGLCVGLKPSFWLCRRDSLN